MSVFGTGGLGSALPIGASTTKPTNASTGGTSFKGEMSAVDKFLKYQEMTPAQKIRASYLAAHGLTEEDLAAMSPEERRKIEEAIVEEIKQKLGAKSRPNEDVS